MERKNVEELKTRESSFQMSRKFRHINKSWRKKNNHFFTPEMPNVQLEIIMNGPLATLDSQRPNIHQELFIVQFSPFLLSEHAKKMEKEREIMRKRKLRQQDRVTDR